MADWDRQPDEPALWFDRFERYRRMGPARTLLGCIHAEEVEKGRKERAVSPAGSWVKAFEKWQWKARAEAWDASQLSIARAEEALVLKQRRAAWAAQAQALQSKAVERLLKLNAEEMKPRDVLAFFSEGMKLELLARGQATDKHEYSVTDIDRAIERQLERLAAAGQDPPAGEAEAGPEPAPEPGKPG